MNENQQQEEEEVEVHFNNLILFFALLISPILVNAQYTGGAGSGYASAKVSVVVQSVNTIRTVEPIVLSNPLKTNQTLELAPNNLLIKWFSVHGQLIDNQNYIYKTPAKSGLYFIAFYNQNGLLIETRKVVVN